MLLLLFIHSFNQSIFFLNITKETILLLLLLLLLLPCYYYHCYCYYYYYYYYNNNTHAFISYYHLLPTQYFGLSPPILLTSLRQCLSVCFVSLLLLLLRQSC